MASPFWLAEGGGTLFWLGMGGSGGGILVGVVGYPYPDWGQGTLSWPAVGLGYPYPEGQGYPMIVREALDGD